MVYDACMGSGSLMLSCRNYSTQPEYIKYYGQELMPTTFNLARMNMFLHGVLPENQHLRNGDTLDADWPTDEETEFDVVTMNPPLVPHGLEKMQKQVRKMLSALNMQKDLMDAGVQVFQVAVMHSSYLYSLQ